MLARLDRCIEDTGLDESVQPYSCKIYVFSSAEK